jgi:hypothetical protein
MLHNTASNRFHPIMFRLAPLPGGAEISPGVQRYKSQAHHTSGFNNRADAIKNINESMAKVAAFGASTATFEWDGDSIPAMVEFFDHTKLKRVLELVEAT